MRIKPKQSLNRKEMLHNLEGCHKIMERFYKEKC